MIIFGHIQFTPACGMSVADTYGTAPAVPAYMKLTGPFIRSNIEQGIHTISIYEFDDDRADEAMAYLQARYERFNAIEGVTTSVEEWLGVGVALKLLDEPQSVTDVLDLVNFRF